MDQNQELKDAIGESIRKRQEEASKTNSEPNPAKAIILDIEKNERELRNEVESLRNCELKGLALNEHLDDIAIKLQVFDKSLSEYSRIVPQYELRKAQQGVKDIRSTFQDIQAELQPKKKFGFNKLKKTTAKKSTNSETILSTNAIKPIQATTDFGCVTKDKSNEELELTNVQDKDVLLNNLNSCRVKILGNPSTLHMTNLKNCTLLSGPISTSVFVENCTDCTFVMACQQLRTHETTNTDFFIHVSSRAIIEYSNGVRFGPYNLNYPQIDSHLKSSGLNLTDRDDSFRKVDDFNWLASDQASPNFRLMTTDEYKSFEI